MKTASTRSLVLCATVATALVACAHESQPPPQAPVSVTSAPVPSEQVDESTKGQLDDAGIATIAATIANGQSERARLAEEIGHDERVRHFAARLLTDAPAATIGTMNLTPRATNLGNDLAGANSRALADLGLLEGMNFDVAFIDAEKRALGQALGLFDESLMPSIKSPQLHHNMTQMRRLLAEELREADYLGASMLGGGTKVAPDTPR